MRAKNILSTLETIDKATLKKNMASPSKGLYENKYIIDHSMNYSYEAITRPRIRNLWNNRLPSITVDKPIKAKTTVIQGLEDITISIKDKTRRNDDTVTKKSKSRSPTIEQSINKKKLY